MSTPHMQKFQAEPDSRKVAALLKRVSTNPYAHLTHEEIRALFTIGKAGMAKIVKLNPPQVLGKINPRHFERWLWENRDIIRGITVK